MDQYYLISFAFVAKLKLTYFARILFIQSYRPMAKQVECALFNQTTCRNNIPTTGDHHIPLLSISDTSPKCSQSHSKQQINSPSNPNKKGPKVQNSVVNKSQ